MERERERECVRVCERETVEKECVCESVYDSVCVRESMRKRV